MAKYLSNRQQNLKIGINSYTENQTVLEVTGKVGIGTTNATQQLDVAGNIRIRGGIYDAYNQVGAAGSVLVSTGAGVSWTSSAGAGAQGPQGAQGATGTFTVYRQSTAPSSPPATTGDYWVDEDDGITYFYYDDGNSSQWVEFGPTPQQIQSGGGTLGIATAGGAVGTGVTLLDFRGAGISTVTVSAGIGTINIIGGGTATPDISPVMMGMIF